MTHAQADADEKSSLENLAATDAHHNGQHVEHDLISNGISEAEQKSIDEIESLCMNCHENVCVFSMVTCHKIST